MGETVTLAKSKGQTEAWQLALQNTKERLQYLYLSGQHSDLEIIFPECTDTFKVHKLVLAMSSPVFDAMIMGPMAVGKGLTLYEDSPRAIRRLLDYMYMDSMDLESVDEALEVYAVAHKYQLDAARTFCSQYVISNLTEKKTLAALEASLLYEDENMHNNCNKLLFENPDAVMGVDCVAVLKKETFRNLLQRQDLEVSSEMVLLNAIIAWGKAQLSHRGEELCSSALRKETEDLLKEVRFLTMSSEEFIDKVIDTNVLSHTECIHILKCIRGAELSTVPESTPLNPSAIRRTKNLLKADLGKVGKCRKLEICDAKETYELLSKVTASRDIMVYHIESDFRGVEMNIHNQSGCKTEACLNHKISTFKTPFKMEKNKEYDIFGTFHIESAVPCTESEDRGNYVITVDDVSLSYQNRDRMNIKLYFTSL